MDKVKQALQSPFSSTENFAITLGLVCSVAGAGYVAHLGFQEYKRKYSQDSALAAVPINKTNVKQRQTALKDRLKRDPNKLDRDDIFEICEIVEYHLHSHMIELHVQSRKERRELIDRNLSKYEECVINWSKEESSLREFYDNQVLSNLNVSQEVFQRVLHQLTQQDPDAEARIQEIDWKYTYDLPVVKGSPEITEELLFAIFSYANELLSEFTPKTRDPTYYSKVYQAFLDDKVSEKFNVENHQILHRKSLMESSARVLKLYKQLEDFTQYPDAPEQSYMDIGDDPLDGPGSQDDD